MPHELGHLQGIEFRDILLSQMGRLKQFWDAGAINMIEYQHSRLRIAYQSKPTLRSALDFCNHSTSFTAGWKIVEG